MSVAIVDASVLVAFYIADDPRRDAIVARLRAGDTLFAPAHLDAEVVSALRGVASRSPAVERAAPRALRHLAGLSIRRIPLAPLLTRMWELRATVAPYDAAYAALGEALDAPVVTCDTGLAAASGPRCRFELIS